MVTRPVSSGWRSASSAARLTSGRARRSKIRLRRGQQLGALKMVDDRQQVRRGDDLDLARPRGLAAAPGGTDNAAASARGRQCGKQYPGDTGQRAVERQLPECHV